MKVSRPPFFSRRSLQTTVAPLVAASVFAATALAPTAAQAQAPKTSSEKPAAKRAEPEPSEAEIERAKALFKEGLTLEKEANWREALERFKAVGKVKMTANVRFHLGLCYENLGQGPEALTQFEAAAKQAQIENATQVTGALPGHIDRLRAENGRITVKAVEKFEGLKVQLDGKDVEFDQVTGVAPGAHKVTASAPDSETSTIDLEIEKGAERTITVDLPRTAKKKAEARKKAEAKRGLKPLQVVAIGGAGVGVATLIASAFTYRQARHDLNDVKGVCPELADCPTEARSTFDRGRDYNTATNVLMGVGAGLIVVSAGVFGYATFYKPAKSAKAKPGEKKAPTAPAAPGAPAPPGGPSVPLGPGPKTPGATPPGAAPPASGAPRKTSRAGSGTVIFAAPSADLVGFSYARSF